ncbi:MAG TPA: YMGG-like glycine zipper-containing protein [Blastocatellia bacterium]|nr:YMGG-like glycine zipper-containing protein [Blastocatellia bacterium]
MKSHFHRLTSLFVTAGLLLMVFSLAGSAQAQTRKRTTRKAVRKSTAAPSAFSVPRGTTMKVRLESAINTKESRDGDRFTAVVETPSKYDEATIEGHIAALRKSGKFKGQTALSLAFDRITLKDGRSAAMAAEVVKVYGEKSAREVDEEGNIKGGKQSSTTVKRSAGGAAAGAVIGAIAGGGKGAAIGAIVGGAAGAGSVYITGTNKVTLDRGTEILIRTTR